MKGFPISNTSGALFQKTLSRITEFVENEAGSNDQIRTYILGELDLFVDGVKKIRDDLEADATRQ